MGLRVALFVAACALAALLSASICSAAEVRGAWITSWDHGFFTQQEADETVAMAKKAGMNALFIEVRKFADAYYDSKIEPRGPEVPAGFDPLAYTIKKAHSEGMQVHAWVVVYRAWCGSDKKPPTDPNHIINKHPDWVLLSNDGKNWAGEGMYLDPGVSEAREYIVSVFEDIAKRYNVDGIQYDYVRYPGGPWGYSEAALKHYYADTGATAKPDPKDPKWLEWKRKQVDALVKLSHDRVKAANPNIQISASTICYGPCNEDFTKTSPYAEVSQDWRKWMEEGLIDINIPMNYKVEKNDWQKKAFREWIDGSNRWKGVGVVYQGIDANNQPVEDMVAQVEATRKAGQPGFVLFSFNASAGRDAKATALGAALSSAPALSLNLASGLDAQASREAFNRGVEFGKKGQLKKAKAEFEKAVALDSGYAEAAYRLGRCYLREKNIAKAREYFTTTLTIDSDHAGAKKELELLDKQK